MSICYVKSNKIYLLTFCHSEESFISRTVHGLNSELSGNICKCRPVVNLTSSAFSVHLLFSIFCIDTSFSFNICYCPCIF